MLDRPGLEATEDIAPSEERVASGEQFEPRELLGEATGVSSRLATGLLRNLGGLLPSAPSVSPLAPPSGASGDVGEEDLSAVR